MAMAPLSVASKFMSPIISVVFMSTLLLRVDSYARNTPNEDADFTLRQVLQAKKMDKWAIWDALVGAQRGPLSNNEILSAKEMTGQDSAGNGKNSMGDLLMSDGPAWTSSSTSNDVSALEGIKKLEEPKNGEFGRTTGEQSEEFRGKEHNNAYKLDLSQKAILSSCQKKFKSDESFSNGTEAVMDCERDLEAELSSSLEDDAAPQHSSSVMKDETDNLIPMANVMGEQLPAFDPDSRGVALINGVEQKGDIEASVIDQVEHRTDRPLSQEESDFFYDPDADFYERFNDDLTDLDPEDFSSERYTVDIDYVDDSESLDPPLQTTGASLAFIFDSTGSMQDELNQVKVGAAQILASLLANHEIVIHNFILVPFNDPDIGPVTVTTNHKIFQERIADISVHGGGDCPEMSIGGLRKALSVARPNSYFYVFTDASAKDYHLQGEVLSLIQQQQAQVVIIMTDTCDDENTAHYQVYEYLAAASSGQVYHLSKSEVGEVLKYVKVSLRPNKVSLLSLNKAAPAANTSDNHVVVVDETIKELTVSVSGRNAGISVQDPSGVKRDSSRGVEPLLTLQNVKILNVKEPDPGQWQVHIKSESDYSVRASGRSEVRFRHGFSTTPTANIAETYHRPLQGASCYLLIQVSDTDTVFNLTTVDLVGLSGSVLERLPLTPVPGAPGVFSAASFTPPSEFFHLGISGVGKDGYQIKRITNTAISSSLPEKPRIILRPKIVGRIHDPVSLVCLVTSLVPFSVQWFKEGRLLGNSGVHPQTCQVEYSIDKLEETSEGNYTCHVKNAAGVEWKTTYLSVIGRPPVVSTIPRITAVVGTFVELSCTIKSDLQASVRWTQLTAPNKYSGILHPVLRGKVYANHSLILPPVAAEDEGYYVCTSENKAGRGEARTYLSVRDPVRVSISPSNATFTHGGSMRLICAGSGRPQPKLEWRRDGVAFTNNDATAYVEEANGELYLVLEFLDKERAGFYSCVATNNGESATANAELRYKEKPGVKAIANSVMVKVGAEAVLECVATGTPIPTISWNKNGQDISTAPRYQMESRKLRIANTQPSDAGELSCIARNEWGEAFDYIGLFVGSPPSFLQRPKDKKIELYHNGTVFCAVAGSPLPVTDWERVDAALNTTRMFLLPSGGLRITHAQLTDAGRYRCLAHNAFGNISAQVSVSITGTEKPATDESVDFSEARVLSGGGASLPCGVSLGNPPGHVTWLLNGEALDGEHSVGREGRLELHQVTPELGGKYECFVRNALGNASRAIQLSVLESPKIVEGDKKDQVVSKIGNRSILRCPITGNPRPKIVWFKNRVPVNISYSMYQDANGDLVFENIAEGNGGSYVCTASNELGSTSVPVLLKVYVPPTPLKGTELPDTPHEVVEGHMVVLNCQMHAVPTPEVVWHKDGSRLKSEDERLMASEYTSNQILRFVATVDDSGAYKCTVSNEVGTATREFLVSILVPPRIADPGEEPLQARAGQSVSLHCDVKGAPTPEVLWRRHGTYLTTNTTDWTLLGSVLLLSVVTEDSAGAYVCDAENSAGITQQTFYLHVTFPPRIVQQELGSNGSVQITLREGDDFSQSCHVEGNPRPIVTWLKDRQALHPYQPGIIILGDNTLLLVQAKVEHAGIYTCRAESEEGSTEKEFRLDVATLPVVSGEIPLRMEVNEGEALILTCPTAATPPPNIRWKKDGLPFLTLIDRGDESPMKLSSDGRELRLAEAHPTDSGNYSCVATNAAGRTDATFAVVVLMTPHFEEFNHLARRTVLVGGSVALNCSVSGNPNPQVSWRKDVAAVTPGSPAGVVLSRDQQHLVIPSARPHHSGTYTCTATNKVNTREREFYVTVLEPPNIEGPVTEEKEVLKGEKLVLGCLATGSPTPNISWFGHDCDGIKFPLNISSSLYEIKEAAVSHSTVFSCEAVSAAGSRVKHFNVTVLEIPQIEGQDEMDEVDVPAGGEVSLRCKVRGQPRPEVTWLHNGRLVNGTSRSRRSTSAAKERRKEVDMEASLTLSAVGQREQGLYTVIASNRAGYSEKHFRVNVAVPPQTTRSEPYEVTAIQDSTALLACPVEATPAPNVQWCFDSDRIVADSRHRFSDGGRQLFILGVGIADSGLYTCLAKNPGGELNITVQLHVLQPPWFLDDVSSEVQTVVGDDVKLGCLAFGLPQPLITWLRNSQVVLSTSESVLEVRNTTLGDAGTYSCVATNVAGAAEKSFHLHVLEPPFLNVELQQASETHRSVSLHRRLKLSCPFSGHPLPRITWFKGDEELLGDANIQIMSQGVDLVILRAGTEHVGEYRCSAENLGGEQSLTFQVAVHVTASWTTWSPWSECTASCGEGLQFRERTCSFGSDTVEAQLSVDKSQCVGLDREQRPCLTICKIDGGWGSWSEWGMCSTTCGPSVRRRQRLCNSPTPSTGAAPCMGPSIEEEPCAVEKCPAIWTEWSEWSECSRSCEGGQHKRTRFCLGGGVCEGEDYQVENCKEQKCGVGRWLPWGDWGTCSATCGKGFRKRVRHCRPAYTRTKPCKDKVQLEPCYRPSCPPSEPPPSTARLHLSGSLNGIPLDSNVFANISDSQVSAHVLTSEVNWFPYAPLLLSPISWSAAAEEDSANNGFSLTSGRFLSQSDVTFDTGEGMKMRAEGQGVGSDGALTVLIEVAGEAPFFEPTASLQIKSLEQDYVQVGEDTLMALSEEVLMLNDQQVQFAVNSSLRYESSRGTMPYYVEKLSISDIQNEYNPAEHRLQFNAAAKIGKKFEKDHCPPGFHHDKRHLHCADIDECETRGCSKGHVCRNTWGSFSCGECLSGYTKSLDICTDVNECEQDRCQHSCINTEGSFICLCSAGFVLDTDGSTCLGSEEETAEIDSSELFPKSSAATGSSILSLVKPSVLFSGCLPGFQRVVVASQTTMQSENNCTDIDECATDPDPCGPDAFCLNVAGSFQCLDISCPPSFHREFPSTTCTADCDTSLCRNGAEIAESIIFAILPLNKRDFVPFADVVELQVEEHGAVVRRQARLVDGHALRLRNTQQRTSLYAPALLEPSRLYRVIAEVESFGPQDRLLYSTEFVVYLTLI